MPLTVWIFTMRRSRIIVLLVALGLIAMAVPVAILFELPQNHRRLESSYLLAMLMVVARTTMQQWI